jgi:hypothetical protein
MYGIIIMTIIFSPHDLFGNGHFLNDHSDWQMLADNRKFLYLQIGV